MRATAKPPKVRTTAQARTTRRAGATGARRDGTEVVPALRPDRLQARAVRSRGGSFYWRRVHRSRLVTSLTWEFSCRGQLRGSSLRTRRLVRPPLAVDLGYVCGRSTPFGPGAEPGETARRDVPGEPRPGPSSHRATSEVDGILSTLSAQAWWRGPRSRAAGARAWRPRRTKASIRLSGEPYITHPVAVGHDHRRSRSRHRRARPRPCCTTPWRTPA